MTYSLMRPPGKAPEGYRYEPVGMQGFLDTLTGAEYRGPKSIGDYLWGAARAVPMIPITALRGLLRLFGADEGRPLTTISGKKRDARYPGDQGYKGPDIYGRY